MGKSDLQKLPELLRRGQVMEVTGLDFSSYAKLVSANPQIVRRIPGLKQPRICKSALFKLLGLEL